MIFIDFAQLFPVTWWVFHYKPMIKSLIVIWSPKMVKKLLDKTFIINNFLNFRFEWLNLVSIWSSLSSQSSQTIGTINATRTIANDPDNWDDLDLLLFDPGTSLTTRVFCLRGARDDYIWKLPIVPVVQIVSIFFEKTGAIGTIGTIIWKSGFTTRYRARRLYQW